MAKIFLHLSVCLLLANCSGKTQSSSVSSANTGDCDAQSASLALTDKPLVYDQVFPIERSHYVAGTRVLQPKTGAVYRCKPQPYAGFCQQWSPIFEPGVGSNWMAAWDLQ